ncbi:hypothetical protein DSL72_002876 [Monilinia vaccinii-corymbosi]|uniref:Uncharacterized protein n=1 Tax=Monilinia vaccinii-corymbosi TaxID=61207 RepID=A0A8A3PDU0_9HELO|nr:hypothetical protein DSL72_002876 [Monilinia vaccinii-corymbosi]
MRVYTRLGVLALSIFLGSTFLTILPQSQYTQHLRKIENGVKGGFWPWSSGHAEEESGIRLVVFGDSWVDDRMEENGEGKGRSWTQVLCEELRCTSQTNLAASLPAASYSTMTPTGAFASTKSYLASIRNTSGHNATLETMLPDFEAQIKSFVALPQPEHKLKETIFVISFGTWDVWHYAALNYSDALVAQEKAVADMFVQLDKLYAHHRATLEATHLSENEHNGSRSAPKPQFRVVIPKLFDPTMLPGWLSQRPPPMKPSNVAEVQKNAIHLLREWDAQVEHSIKSWFASTPKATTSSVSAKPKQEKVVSLVEEIQGPSRGRKSAKKLQGNAGMSPPRKDIFYYDLNQFLTEIILEHRLEDGGISDATGLGTQESPYVSVSDPCLREGDSGGERRMAKGGGSMEETGDALEINGYLVCESPDEHLFWDDFTIGGLAKEKLGREVARMIKQGLTLRAT